MTASRFLPALLVALLAVAPASAAPPADAASSSAAAAERPERGARMAEVEKKYGAPETRYPAVGQPPITRWDYPGMIVYFENDRVVHAVLVAPAG